MAIAKSEVGRLALRAEGNMWNAYWAMPGTMKDAIWLGSIALAVIEKDKALKERFVSLMRDAVAYVLKDITGKDVQAWDTRVAPTHERTQE